MSRHVYIWIAPYRILLNLTRCWHFCRQFNETNFTSESVFGIHKQHVISCSRTNGVKIYTGTRKLFIIFYNKIRLLTRGIFHIYVYYILPFYQHSIPLWWHPIESQMMVLSFILYSLFLYIENYVGVIFSSFVCKQKRHTICTYKHIFRISSYIARDSRKRISYSWYAMTILFLCERNINIICITRPSVAYHTDRCVTWMDSKIGIIMRWTMNGNFMFTNIEENVLAVYFQFK